jgi:hypothetical protein
MKASRVSSCPVFNTSCRPFRLATVKETVKFSLQRTSDRMHCKRAEQTLKGFSHVPPLLARDRYRLPNSG